MNRYSKLCGMLKNVKRSGWLRYLNSSQVQSVADHSAKIAFLTLYLRGIQNVNYMKCLQMALIHDIAEGIVGDYTPYDHITKQEKHHQQLKAVKTIFQPLGEQNCNYMFNIWMQFEQGQIYEAKIVKDLDKLQMMQQAYQYQIAHKANKLDLTQFYSAVKDIKTELVKGWAHQLIKERDIYMAQKSNK